MKPLNPGLFRTLLASGACSLFFTSPQIFAQAAPTVSDFTLLRSNAVSTPPPSTPAFSAAPLAPTAFHYRAISPETAAKLAETAPKFAPAKIEVRSPIEQPVADKPKNGIVRLPDYVVREAPPPTFKSRELLTPAGKLELAYKRRPGLRFGSLPFLNNNAIALAFLEQDFALERAAELKELGGLSPAEPVSAAKAKASEGSSSVRKN